MVVEPLSVVRAGLRLLVNGQPDLEVCGEADAPAEAIEVLRDLERRSDLVVIVSIASEDRHDALWLIRSIRDQFSTVRILAMGVAPSEWEVSAALFFGADGFVHKRVDPKEFLDAIRGVAGGEVVLAGIDWDAMPGLVTSLDRFQQPTMPFLTGRQHQILALAAEGLTARQIGERLAVRERTVTTQFSRIYGKLKVRNRAEAVAAAARSGLMAQPAQG